MIKKKTIIDQIEITRNGNIHIRIGLLLIEDGNEISCEWHRTAIEPGGDVDAQISLVNSHLAALTKVDGRVVNYPPVESDGIKRVKRIMAALRA